MSKLLGGGMPKFKAPTAIAAPAAAVAPVAAPVSEVASGGADSGESQDELRKKFRPSKSGIGSTGTGLSL